MATDGEYIDAPTPQTKGTEIDPALLAKKPCFFIVVTGEVVVVKQQELSAIERQQHVGREDDGTVLVKEEELQRVYRGQTYGKDNVSGEQQEALVDGSEICTRSAGQSECLLLGRQRYQMLLRQLNGEGMSKSALLKQQQQQRNRIVGALQRVKLFQSLSESDRATLFDHMHIALYVPGQNILQQGQRNHDFFVVSDGHVTLTQTQYDKPLLAPAAAAHTTRDQ
jgi:hypothetical protein